MAEAPDKALKKTPLHAMHLSLGAKMVPFAGYEMPLQYPAGILTEHLQVRERAGLFDVSHMGQAFVEARDFAAAAEVLERLMPGNLTGLAPGRVRYTLLLNEAGGIIDDLMVTHAAGEGWPAPLYMVVNASRKAVDFAAIGTALEAAGLTLSPTDTRALLALQGPAADRVLTSLGAEVADMVFMSARPLRLGDHEVFLSRSGYTGEDGFEISVAAEGADDLARRLLDHDDVAPIGLGARDSLRLEAGLCLYGNDLDEETSPAEADLGFAVPKRRRETGGFAGAARILAEFADGPPRQRVGLLPEGAAPARAGTVILNAAGETIGSVTSGVYSPSLKRPIAMGYVKTSQAVPGTPVQLLVRGKPRPAHIAEMPFVPHRYRR